MQHVPKIKAALQNHPLWGAAQFVSNAIKITLKPCCHLFCEGAIAS
jgi:hypothetical protein